MIPSALQSPRAAAFERDGAVLHDHETGDAFAGLVDRSPALLIGLSASLSWGFMRDLIRRVRKQPNAPVLSILDGAPREIVDLARHAQIDVGFVYGAHDWSGLRREELWREPLMVLLPEDHPLARDTEVSGKALAKETFLVSGGPLERALGQQLVERAIGVAPSNVLAVPAERATVIDMVGLGFGLAIATSSALGAFHPGVTYRSLAPAAPAVPFHAVWRASNGDETLAGFLRTARALAERWRG